MVAAAPAPASSKQTTIVTAVPEQKKKASVMNTK